jgi:hypothetical protein
VRGKGILVATAAVLAGAAVPALAGVIGTAGSITYKDATASLMNNEDVAIQMDCSAAKRITGVAFGSDFLNLDPQTLRMHSANAAEIRVAASGNDNLTAYTMCTTAKVKYVEASKEHLAVSTGKIKVKCPTRRHVVGGGVDAGQRFIESTYPYDSKDRGKKPDDGWKATTSGLQADTVEATAACSPVEPKYTKETTTVSPSSTTAVIPNCKGDTNLASVGAHLSGPIQYGSLNSMRPRDDGDAGSVPGDEVLVNMGNDNSNPDAEKLTGYAICID